MEHERGAFKVIRWIWLGGVKKWPQIRWFHDGGTALAATAAPKCSAGKLAKPSQLPKK